MHLLDVLSQMLLRVSEMKQTSQWLADGKMDTEANTAQQFNLTLTPLEVFWGLLEAHSEQINHSTLYDPITPTDLSDTLNAKPQQ